MDQSERTGIKIGQTASWNGTIPDCRVWQFSMRSRVCKTESQVCKCVDLSYKNHKCADLVDKYISNIFPRQANSVDVLCGLETTLYNLPPCGTVNTISGNLGLQIFKNFLTRGQPWWHLAKFSPTHKCAWEFSRKFLRCALAKNPADWALYNLSCQFTLG